MTALLAALAFLAHVAIVLACWPALRLLVLLIEDCWVGESAQVAAARRRAGGS
ncbi:hypothetical protein BRM3_09070 [Brachybacterium huguangmaarense]|uniref:Uncharacterized protein n=1 Tax=Brachybacterium huguangmaarense TaxID=1652028 RepID=A0ABY6FZI5_9MICO|nr:hypothetical protein [Brachybacterium huguangmaarense]UYG15796.1 hypothetical protein BRM3_09070 [Brachybacterium huguangmaarense]